MLRKLASNKVVKNLGERIYISRRKANRRKLVNQESVEQKLMEHGFEIVCMEDYSFMEQISIANHAKVIAGIHGAGLCNVLFMENEGKVLELAPDIDDHSLIRIPFWRIAAANNALFYIQFCEMKGQHSDAYDNDLNVDIEDLENNLNNISLQ